jgi:hypothetical protein
LKALSAAAWLNRRCFAVQIGFSKNLIWTAVVTNLPHNFRRIPVSGKTKWHWAASLRPIGNRPGVWTAKCIPHREKPCPRYRPT